MLREQSLHTRRRRRLTWDEGPRAVGARHTAARFVPSRDWPELTAVKAIDGTAGALSDRYGQSRESGGDVLLARAIIDARCDVCAFAQLEHAETLGHVNSLPPPFSAIQRDAAVEIAWCERHSTGVIVYTLVQSCLVAAASPASAPPRRPTTGARARQNSAATASDGIPRSPTRCVPSRNATAPVWPPWRSLGLSPSPASRAPSSAEAVRSRSMVRSAQRTWCLRRRICTRSPPPSSAPAPAPDPSCLRTRQRVTR
jgi:hypothetical protein